MELFWFSVSELRNSFGFKKFASKPVLYCSRSKGQLIDQARAKESLKICVVISDRRLSNCPISDKADISLEVALCSGLLLISDLPRHRQKTVRQITKLQIQKTYRNLINKLYSAKTLLNERLIGNAGKQWEPIENRLFRIGGPATFYRSPGTSKFAYLWCRIKMFNLDNRTQLAGN